MYRVAVYSQLITGKWIKARSCKMELEIAKAVMDRMSNRLYSQLRNKEILDYKVIVEIAE